MRIAHFGTFDVDNFGDLLFPHVAEWRWPNVAWTHVSPSGTAPQFRDALPLIDVPRAFERRFDAVVVGGGNIIHARGTSLPIYESVSRTAYASLWFGAGVLASEQRIPLIVNAPSVSPSRVGPFERRLIRTIARGARYAAFRDASSSSVATDGSAPVVPDTAFDLARVWPLPSDVATEDGSIAIHVNRRYMRSVADTASKIDALARRMNGHVRLLPIGPCHGDVATAGHVADAMRYEAEVVPVGSLHDFARAIARSSLYVGSSMHGFITALAYGRRALLVLNERPMHKFAGLLEVADLPSHAIRTSWADVPEREDVGVRLSPEGEAAVQARLDEHWDRVTAAATADRVDRLPEWTHYWKSLARLSAIERSIVGRFRRGW